MGFNQESRTKNAGRNTISAIGNKIAILLLTFISRKVFIVYIGVEYLGINALFANVLTLLSMADLGIGTAMNVSLYRPIAEKDCTKITALLNYFKVIYRIIAVTIAVIGVLLLPFLKYIVNMDSKIPYLYVYYLIFVLKNVVSYLYIYKSALIRADQKTYLINKIEVFVNVFKVILQIICILLFKNYLSYILLEVLSILLQNVIVSINADKEYDFINENDILDSRERKKIFSDILSVFLYKISWSLLNGTDSIIMSIIVGTIFVGLYSNYYTITSSLETFIALLFTSLTASVGNLIATSSADNRYKTFKTMQMVSFWICGIASIGLLFLMQDFIELWLGKEFLLDKLTLVAIVINLFFSTCMRPVWTFREGTGMYRQIRYIMFVTALLNLFLSIVLGKYLGGSGVLFATSISKLLTYFWYEPNILFKKFFKVKPSKYYIDYLENFLLMFICLIICCFGVSWIRNVSIFNWILKAAICIFVVNCVYFIRYFRTEEFYNIKKRIFYKN